MSATYNMSIEISGHDIGRREAIKIAAEREWGFDFWKENRGSLRASADDSLCYRVSVEQFAEQFSLAVWRANGKFCNVEIVAGCLEEIPYEEYLLTEEDYMRFARTDESLYFERNTDIEEQFYSIQECADSWPEIKRENSDSDEE